jgi:hypothetical protein
LPQFKRRRSVAAASVMLFIQGVGALPFALMIASLARETPVAYQCSPALSTQHLAIHNSPPAQQTRLVGAGPLAMQETLKKGGLAR